MSAENTKQRKARTGEEGAESSGDESATASSSARRRPAVGPPVFKGKEKAGTLKMLVPRTFSSAWKPRWVKLSEGNLLIFKTQKDSTPEKSYDMRSFIAAERIQDDRSEGLPWIFSIRTAEKFLMFQAQDERELYEWLSILAKPRENRPPAKRRSVSFDHSSGTSDTIDRETVAVAHVSGGSNIVMSTSTGSSQAVPSTASAAGAAGSNPNRASPRTASNGPSPRSAPKDTAVVPATVVVSSSSSSSQPITLLPVSSSQSASQSQQDPAAPPLLTTPKKKEPSPRTIDGPVISSPRQRTPREDAEILEKEIRARLENELRAKFEEEMRRRVEEEVKRATERIVAEQIATLTPKASERAEKSDRKHKHKHKHRDGEGDKRRHKHRSTKSTATSKTASPREDGIAAQPLLAAAAPAPTATDSSSSTNQIGGHSLRVKNVPPLATQAASSQSNSGVAVSSSAQHQPSHPPTSSKSATGTHISPSQIELEPVANGMNSKRASRRGSIKGILLGDGIFVKSDATSPHSAGRRSTADMSRSVSLDMRSQKAAENTLTPAAASGAPAAASSSSAAPPHKSVQIHTSTSSSSMKRSASAPAMELNNNPNDPRRAKAPAYPAGAKPRQNNNAEPPPKSKSTRGFWSKYRIHWENLLKL